MSPALLLILLLTITLGAYCIAAIRRRRHHGALRQLAAQWQMNYSTADTLRLTDRIAHRFPIIGAANLRVSDVIYGSYPDRYRYVFTAEFTCGVVRTKRRMMRVCGYSEPRGRRQPTDDAMVTLAPESESLMEQYAALAPAAAPRTGEQENR